MSFRAGFGTVNPYLVTPRLDGLVDFLVRGLGAVETLREKGASGGIHVELRIGDSMIMVGGGNRTQTGMLYLYVDDPDAAYERALAVGARSIAEPKDSPDGERRAGARGHYQPRAATSRDVTRGQDR